MRAKTKTVLGRDTTAKVVAGMLRDEIQDVGLAPGTRLRQNEVAKRFGVSTTPVREAFAQLTSERLAQAPSPARQSLPGVTDLTSLITFYAFHESYHVGQLGYARRLLGRDGIAG